MTPTVPFYSATLDDPRAKPRWDAEYWVDNLRQPVRFGAAVQAALDDGFRVFGEISPHPLLMRAVEQNAHANDVQVHAVPCMRRQQEMPHGLRGFVANLHSAGAAVDFSVLYPSGRLVDAPLPTWTHKQLLLGGNGANHQAQNAATIAVHPLLGAHVRLPEEPERHAWHAQVGIAALPWLADHTVNNVAAYPGAAYCEMALAAAQTVFGESSEVHDVEFEQLLLLDDDTEVAAGASVEAAGVADFSVESHCDDERIRRAEAKLVAVQGNQPPHHDLDELLEAHPLRIDGADIRRWFANRKVQYGPAFSALTAVHTADGSTLVAEVSLPGDIRSQQSAYGVHPAILDACFQSVAAALGDDHGDGGLLLPRSVRQLRRYGSSRGARYCYISVTSAGGAAVEADLSLVDEHGAVVLEVQGLRMASADGHGRDHLLSERLSSIDWYQREMPDQLTADPGTWLLVTPDGHDSAARGLEEALTSRGAHCRAAQWPGDLAGVDGVVVFCPPSVRNVDEQTLVDGRHQVSRLVAIARQLSEIPGTTRLFVVTRGAQAVEAEDPINLAQAGVRGLVRVIGAEHPQLHPTQIDLDEYSDPTLVAAQLLSGTQDDETAWRDGRWYTARLRSAPLRADERRTATVDYERDGARLEIRTPGDPETLELAAVDRRPPRPGEIEVAVAASSINFADVLVAFGRYPSFDGRMPQLGLDFAGVVTAVGHGVTDHKAGDLVGGFCASGCWGTFVTCDARLAAALPPGLAPDAAAAVSTTYGTAWYGLHELARIRSGDKVLIHSATGGVGQAAIAIARHAGAEIFATAGSPQRRTLLREMGIEHVYDSRTTEFADQIRRDTDGYGVDIVLNSLTGAAQRAGLESLAFGGCFIEIGKRDIYGNTRLGLYPFRRNLSFHCVDLALMAATHPEQIGELMGSVYGLVADGVLPVAKHTEYRLSKAANAIRTMSAAEHTGKLVLSIPQMGHRSAVISPERAQVFRSDGAYIITGGLGGLGLVLAAEMAAAGCGRIVVNSRSRPNPHAHETIDRLRASGVDVQVECGDIAEPATAGRLVTLATASGLPLRGVLHAAGVVDDATISSITDELIERDWAPKVYGAWNLHHATKDQSLDWFCSFSSAAAMLGSPGQGAYAAANSWLDSFTLWRRNQGLPANAIAWGAWAQVGRGMALAERGDTAMIAPDEGAYAFEALLRHDRAHTGYFSMTDTPWLTALASRSPFAEAFRASEDRDATGTDTLRTELGSLSKDELVDRLRRMVASQVSLILRQTIDNDRPFSDHGLDSLGNLELRTHIEAQTRIRVTPKAIASHNTVRSLARHLTDTLSAEPNLNLARD